MSTSSPFHIEIRGAKVNNLQHIDLNIPKGKLVVITGVSGSGKSSLVHDLIYKEAQRLYFESLSIDSRRLLKSYAVAEVESISGLSPVVGIGQKTNFSHSGSTVGTLSGIGDLLRLLMARFAKSTMDISPLKQSRRLFSFNNPYGACPQCKGLGLEEVIDPQRVIKDEHLSLREGALKITTPTGYTVYSQVTIDVMNQVCESEGFSVDIPWNKLTEANKEIIFYGSEKLKIPFGKHSLESRMKWSGITAKPREEGYYRGIIPIMEEILKRDRNDNILRFVKSQTCSCCHGNRLNKQALSFEIEGKNMAALQQMDLFELNSFCKYLLANKANSQALNKLLDEILQLSNSLIELGLGHLQSHRSAASLSTGEMQRIRLAMFYTMELSDLLYVFDEPSVGLHNADQLPLKKMLKKLVSKGNTVLLIEHEREMIRIAECIIDIGPLAGTQGGQLLFNGPMDDFLQADIPNSLTLKYLLKENDNTLKSISQKKYFSLKGADIHNLKNIDVRFLASGINVVCGVSGSGKTSLVMDCLVEDFQRKQRQYLEDTNLPQQIISIDQSPIGRTPRSNPATYTKVFDKIRTLFAAQNEAKKLKLKKNHFSFNVKGGRCEDCQGAGYTLVGMHFIGNVEIACESCNSQRFNPEILAVKYRNKNIKQVLDMTITEAVHFFEDQKDIHIMLAGMEALGLGYLTLGQRATSLSGGEAQRVKLATEMIKNTKKSALYILDEPSTGLHSYDVEILSKAIQNISNQGHSIIIIEHHEDLIRLGEHIIELGPASGKNGGQVVFQGHFNDFIQGNTLTAKTLISDPIPMDSSLNKKANQFIEFKGVETHNLKNIDVKIPKNKLTVFTGVSGSGKSSMAVDTLFKASQESYFATFPNYLRHRLNQKSEAQFQSVKGLTVSLFVEHKRANSSLRSTLGTYSGIMDLYRLLYSRLAVDNQGNLSNQESSFFSFNKLESACPQCKGLGEITTADPIKFITNPQHSIYENAIQGNKTAAFYMDKNGQFYWTLQALSKAMNLDLSRPWNSLDTKTQDLVLFGNPDLMLEVDWHFNRKGRNGNHQFTALWQGLIPLINEEYQRKHADHRAMDILPIMSQELCGYCQGTRYRKEVLNYQIHNYNIAQINNLSIKNSIKEIKEIKSKFSQSEQQIAQDIISEITNKLQRLVNLELGYLHLNRSIQSLSDGEMQRVQLAGNLANKMSGITYIFDEPTRGLHPKNSQVVLDHLVDLSRENNTVIAIEHNPQFIKQADWVMEFGPEAGTAGGEIIAQYPGSKYQDNSSTNRIYPTRIQPSDFIHIVGANANNLKQIELEIPLQQLVGICGVSGSGKTSLLRQVIHQSAVRKKANYCTQITGLKKFDQVELVNADLQSSSSYQTLAQFMGLLDYFKKCFSKTESAKKLKLKANYFSYNSAEGKCKLCGGKGFTAVKMDFMTDVEEVCTACNGSRYQAEVLKHRYLNHNIAELLQLTIAEALNLFKNDKNVHHKLDALCQIGLSYLSLGQSIKQLSHGELQRLKLANTLFQKQQNNTLFLLDEPSKGLSNSDIKKLLFLLNQLVSKGHSIICVEHNPLVLSQCQHLIELGPEAAENGGRIIAQGNAAQIRSTKESLMKKFL